MARNEEERFCIYGRIFAWKIKVLLKCFRGYWEIAQLMVTFASDLVSHMTVRIFLSVGETVDIKATTKHESAKSIFKIFHLFITIPFKTFLLFMLNPSGFA